MAPFDEVDVVLARVGFRFDGLWNDSWCCI